MQWGYCVAYQLPNVSCNVMELLQQIHRYLPCLIFTLHAAECGKTPSAMFAKLLKLFAGDSPCCITHGAATG